MKGIYDHEGSRCLLDDSEHPHSKLLQNGKDSWIAFDFMAVELTFAGVGIKSANDCPHRDPETIEISVPKAPWSNEWK